MAAAAEKYDVFKAIADPTRREVLRLLSENERPISEIADHFDITRTAVTKHLQILKDAELITGRKEGREKIYHLNPEPLTEVKQWISYYEKFWSNKLSMLRHIVENK